VARFKGIEKFESLYGVNIRLELIKRLHLPDGFTFRFLNDAACFAMGEACQGQVSEHKKLLHLHWEQGLVELSLTIDYRWQVRKEYPTMVFLYHVPFKNSVADYYFSTRWFLKTYEKNRKTINRNEGLVGAGNER